MGFTLAPIFSTNQELDILALFKSYTLNDEKEYHSMIIIRGIWSHPPLNSNIAIFSWKEFRKKFDKFQTDTIWFQFLLLPNEQNFQKTPFFEFTSLSVPNMWGLMGQKARPNGVGCPLLWQGPHKNTSDNYDANI